MSDETKGTSQEDINRIMSMLPTDEQWSLCTEVERLRGEVAKRDAALLGEEAIADAWRAEVAEVEAERDELRAALAAANDTLIEYALAVLKGEPAPIVPAANGGAL